MTKPVFCTAGDTGALRHAANQLIHWGYQVVNTPSPEVTHLLLPVPSLEADGTLKGGHRLEDVLEQLPKDVAVLGGNLPSLPCPCVDFLQDEYYLQENAAITARCALAQIRQARGTLAKTEAMIIGWGRIGKQLTPLLQAAGATVTIAARKDSSLREAAASGCRTVLTGNWDARHFDIIVNTAPAPLLDQKDTKPEALLMDLASVRGIEGDRVIWARGLPNRDAPDASGMLMAKTALRFALRKE